MLAYKLGIVVVYVCQKETGNHCGHGTVHTAVEACSGTETMCMIIIL